MAATSFLLCNACSQQGAPGPAGRHIYIYAIILSEPGGGCFAVARSKLSEKCNLAPAALMTPGNVILLGVLLFLGTSLATLILPSLPATLTDSWDQILLLVVPSTTSEGGRCGDSWGHAGHPRARRDHCFGGLMTDTVGQP